MTTITTDTHLATFGVADLMTKAFELTHRLHELEPYNGTAPGATKIAQARAERDAIVREMERRSAGMERALVAVEAAERTMRFVDTIVCGMDTTEQAKADQTVLEARVALDMMMERTTTTTCSLVKDQGISDRIAQEARDVVRPIREAVRQAKVQ